MDRPIVLPIEDVEPWEGDRFLRPPRFLLEKLTFRWDRSAFYIFIKFLTATEGRGLAVLTPFCGANVHFLGKWHLYNRIHSTYSPPRSSRARRIADHWEFEAEREREASSPRGSCW